MPRSPTPSNTPSVWVDAPWAWPTLTRCPTQASGISFSGIVSDICASLCAASYDHSIAKRLPRSMHRSSRVETEDAPHMVMLILPATKTATLGGDGHMADGNLLRLGGVSGLLAVVSMIPAYLVGYPDAPGLLEAQTYFDAESGMFVFSNGILPSSTFFFLLFLGVLYGMLRSAGGEGRE